MDAGVADLAQGGVPRGGAGARTPETEAVHSCQYTESRMIEEVCAQDNALY